MFIKCFYKMALSLRTIFVIILLISLNVTWTNAESRRRPHKRPFSSPNRSQSPESKRRSLEVPSSSYRTSTCSPLRVVKTEKIDESCNETSKAFGIVCQYHAYLL